MGLRDESWCADCGKSQPYSPDDVICGDCTSEAYEKRSLELINYMKLHILSLEQDSQEVNIQMDKYGFEDDMESDEYRMLEIEDISLTGQLIASRHLMSVATGILGILTEEK